MHSAMQVNKHWPRAFSVVIGGKHRSVVVGVSRYTLTWWTRGVTSICPSRMDHSIVVRILVDGRWVNMTNEFLRNSILTRDGRFECKHCVSHISMTPRAPRTTNNLLVQTKQNGRDGCLVVGWLGQPNWPQNGYAFNLCCQSSSLFSSVQCP